MQALADDLGVELEIMDIAFDGVVPAVPVGAADIALVSLSATEERKQTSTSVICILKAARCCWYRQVRKKPIRRSPIWTEEDHCNAEGHRSANAAGRAVPQCHGEPAAPVPRSCDGTGCRQLLERF